jgi:hypothetical protein
MADSTDLQTDQLVTLARQSGINRELIAHLLGAGVKDADVIEAIRIANQTDPFKRPYRGR